MIGHVLVVEPLTTNRIVMKARLASAHYGVTCCETLDAAIIDVHDAQPDLVFFDANMGLPALAKLRLSLNETTDGANIPIVAIGNGSEGHLLANILNHGGQDLMQWPIDAELMQARLRSLMRQTRSLKNLRLRSLGIPSNVGDLASITPHKPITVVARTPARAATWAGRIRAHMPYHQVLSSSYAGILDPRLNASDGATYLLVSDPASEPEDILHILSTLKTRSNGASALYLTAFPEGANQQAAAALDMGAADVVFTDQSESEIAARLGAVAQRGSEISGLNAVLEDGLRLALIDPLTGLHNRRYSDHTLTQMAREAQTAKQSMAVMIFDVDHFKQVNDDYGHITGDRVLARMAATLRTHLEDFGLLARIGGEEFLAAIPATNAQEAITIANSVRRAVEQMEFSGRTGEAKFKVTLSIGISITDGTGSPMTMIEDADEALYRAKSDGRNRARLSRTPVAA